MLKMFSQEYGDRSRILNNVEKQFLEMETRDQKLNINTIIQRNFDASNRPSSSIFKKINLILVKF